MVIIAALLTNNFLAIGAAVVIASLIGILVIFSQDKSAII